MTGTIGKFTSDEGIQISPSSIYGLRSFAANRTQDSIRLAGVTYDDFYWEDGTNTAFCKDWTDDPFATTDITVANHMVNHSCGFWAYYGTENPYHDVDGISGIIESFGLTVMGEEGFRSEKAKIVALADPGGDTQFRLFSILIGFSWLIIAGSLVSSAFFTLLGNLWLIWFMVAQLVLVVPTFFLHRKKNFLREYAKEYRNLLAVSYPSAKIYDSYNVMVAEWKNKIMSSRPQSDSKYNTSSEDAKRGQ